MGFSIGGLLAGLGPVVGSVLGGPAGGALGGLLGAVGGAFTRPPSPVLLSTPAPAAVPSPVSRFFDSSPVLAAAGRLPRLLPLPLSPTFGRGNGQPSRLRSILDVASSAAGKRVTARDVVNAAKACGLETAASSFGVSVEDVCFVVIHGMRRRRRRGISAADLRRTRSTIRKVSNIRRDLKKLSGR